MNPIKNKLKENSLDTNSNPSVSAIHNDTPSHAQRFTEVAPPVIQSQRTEVVFVESNVADYQTLMNGVNPGAEVHILDASLDGLAQMAQILTGRSGIDAIHILSHGSEGSVQLGALKLTAQNLGEHAADLATIGGALDANADILLYGCSVAAGSDGAALVNALARATQADIAASINTTGSSAQGGDWVLEIHTGQIESSTLASDPFQGTLANSAPVVGAGGISTLSFAAKVDYATASSSSSVTSADVNGDGQADLIAANFSSHSVSVRLNNGNGTFAAKVDHATGVNPISVISADVNGDGKADLIAANYNEHSASVLLGGGDGTFAAKADYATGETPSSVTSADVNGDGKADLITANKGSGDSVSVLLNNGNGTFAAKVDYVMGVMPSSVTSADVNGDGKADLITANHNTHNVSVRLNNGNGTFAAKTDYTTGTNPSSVTSADVNGDGKADLIAANYSDSLVSVLLNNGNGTFAATVDYATGATPTLTSVGFFTHSLLPLEFRAY